MKLVMGSVGIANHPNARAWEPDDPDCVYTTAFMEIGPRKFGKSEPARSKGTDLFTVQVATPAGLAGLEAKEGILAARRLLVMRRYDLDDLLRWLERTVASCERETWNDCVDSLRQFFHWEFEYALTGKGR